MKTGSMGRRENISRNKTDSGSSTLIPPTHASLFSFFFVAGDGASLALLSKASSPGERQDFTMTPLLSIHPQRLCVQERTG